MSIPIKPFMNEFWTLPIKDEVLPKILYKNALRVFKLEEDPLFKQMYTASTAFDGHLPGD